MADALDFSKIWGTNGNITYDFTDDNYLKGWNFIGNVPPARGMFDKLQQLGDMKDQYLYNQLKELTTKQYTVDDTLKPTANEAVLATLLSNLANEVKQNKGTDDWKTAPATNLATLAALVGNLASGSDVTWEGNKFTNAKLGITGLMGQNGYICFGKNFGGLILQWGVTTYNSYPNGQVIIPAISFNSFFAGVVVDRGIKWNTGGTYAGVDYVEGNVIFWPLYIGDPQTVSRNGTNYYWLILCA